MRRIKIVKLYMQIIENKIVAVDTEKNLVCDTEIEINNIDEFYHFAEKYGELDESVEEQVKDLLESNVESKSIETYKIKHWVSNRSFGELIDMYECGEIKKPDMQREFVWDSQKSSRLIESIILGLPIPPLFLLEVGNNEYELIDGFQRVTTVANFVSGRPWSGDASGKRVIKSKLSGNISKELIGKSFDKLEPEYQRSIKRSTIPLIEFRQIGPNDLSSKYLIFERINTGSEKLNQMQIRKALAYGTFIKSLYNHANKCEKFKSIFSTSVIKKDGHIEAFLRVYVMTQIIYHNYQPDKAGINNILNHFCESYRDTTITEDYIDKMNNALALMEAIFEDKSNMFKRVEQDSEGIIYFAGNLNVSILEAMLGVAIEKNLSITNVDVDGVRDNYKKIMNDVITKSVKRQEENPFSTSTGTKDAIEKRFTLCEKILGQY